MFHVAQTNVCKTSKLGFSNAKRLCLDCLIAFALRPQGHEPPAFLFLVQQCQRTGRPCASILSSRQESPIPHCDTVNGSPSFETGNVKEPLAPLFSRASPLSDWGYMCSRPKVSSIIFLFFLIPCVFFGKIPEPGGFQPFPVSTNSLKTPRWPVNIQ